MLVDDSSPSERTCSVSSVVSLALSHRHCQRNGFPLPLQQQRQQEKQQRAATRRTAHTHSAMEAEGMGMEGKEKPEQQPCLCGSASHSPRTPFSTTELVVRYTDATERDGTTVGHTHLESVCRVYSRVLEYWDFGCALRNGTYHLHPFGKVFKSFQYILRVSKTMKKYF